MSLSRKAGKKLRRKAIPASRSAEMLYVKVLTKNMKPLQALVKKGVAEQYTPPKTKQDADKYTGPWNIKAQYAGAAKATATRVGPMFDRMSGAVRKQTKKDFERVVGIDTHEFGIDHEIAMAREANIALIQNASEDFLEQVEDAVGTAFEEGWRIEDLIEELINRCDVSDSRAELIARDQTLKLSSNFNRIRMQNAGIKKYEWSTSNDDRVREEHAALEGQEFYWDDPPEPGNPGEDFQCRCAAVPILPGDDEDEDTEEDEETTDDNPEEWSEEPH